MDARLFCPRGHRWPPPEADAPAGGRQAPVCPECGLAAETHPPRHADALLRDRPTLRLGLYRGAVAAPPEAPGYEILDEIGRGGAAVVYRARCLRLNRVVALKMLAADGVSRSQEYARFLSEAEVTAGLRHPNIVQVYEIGEAAGRPFFALEYVEGGSLAQRLRGSAPPPRAAARLIADVARAVDAAHRQGVIHRDLKPANILLAAGEGPAADCTPKVADFGLAKRRDAGLKTTAGFVLGTPCYMAPEQAAGRAGDVGPASDVYALGAILYECLTGRPPFDGDTPLATMQRVLCEDPAPPAQLRPQTPADLGNICLKCLQKPPARRYASAAALADDLQRYLDGQAVLARPAAPAERLVRWTRRRPAAAALFGVSLAALAVLLAGGAWHVLRMRDALADADRARVQAQEDRDASLRAMALVEERDRLVGEFVYAAQVRRAQQLWFHADLDAMRERLAPYAAPGESDPREFTWRYLWRISHADRRTLEGHAADVYFVTYSPDGGRLLTAGRDGTLRLWDAATGHPLHTLKGYAGDANAAAFSPDGSTLASVGDDGRVLLWDAETGEGRARLPHSGEALQTVAWSPAGGLIAAAGQDRFIHLWDARSGQALPCLEGHEDQVESTAFRGDGRALASGSRDGLVIVWDLARMAPVRSLSAGGAGVQAVAWSPDGRRLAAACGDGAVRLWDADTWAPREPLRLHDGEVQDVAFSPDGKTLASCGNDHLVLLSDAATGAPRNALRGHGDRVWSVAFSPDGKTLASAGRDRVVKLWDPERKQDWQPLPLDGLQARAAALDPRGRTVALAQDDGSVALAALRGDAAAAVLPPQTESRAVALAYSPDGRRLGAEHGDGTVVVWDVEGRSPRVLRAKSPLRFPALALSADGLLACGAADGSVQLWDAATGAALPSPAPPGEECTCVAFAPAGGPLAVALRARRQVVLYDCRSGNERMHLPGHRADVTCMAFGGDGRTLATGSADQSATLWDLETGREKTGGMLGHAGALSSVAVCPGGRTIATGGADRTVRLWDAATGQDLGVLPGHAGRVCLVAFTPDGEALVSAADGREQGEVRLWSAGPSPGDARP